MLYNTCWVYGTIDRNILNKISFFCLRQCFTKFAPQTTSGPRDQLKWSANPYTNQYFGLRGPLKYFQWSAQRKSLGTTGLRHTLYELKLFEHILKISFVTFRILFLNKNLALKVRVKNMNAYYSDFITQVNFWINISIK